METNHLSMLASELVAGIDRIGRLNTFFCLTLALICLTSACTLVSENNTKQKSAKVEANDSHQEEDLPELPFPAKASRHHTRILLLTTPQPQLIKINSCMEQITTIAANAGSQEEMIVAKLEIAKLVDIDFKVYHYCFFHLMAKLDERMERGGSLIPEMATIFLDGFRALWILANALDAPTDQDHYFRFLRTRYMQMSNDYFGRPLEIVGEPMGNIKYNPMDKPSPSSSPQKSANKVGKK